MEKSRFRRDFLFTPLEIKENKRKRLPKGDLSLTGFSDEKTLTPLEIMIYYLNAACF